MKTSTMESKKISLISVIIIILIWKVASFSYHNEALLPSPESIIINMIIMIQSPDTFYTLVFTLFRGLSGFILSLVTGMIFGTIAGINHYIEKSLHPLLAVIKSTPFMSVILLLLIWFGTEKTPIFAGFLVSFPIIYTNVLQGTKNIDRNLIEMSKIYGIGIFQIIKNIYLPSTAPFIFAGIASAFSIGWKVTVGSEILSQPKYAIGTRMWESKLYIEIDMLLAWTVTTILISYLIELLIKKVEGKIVRWKYETESNNH